MIADQIDNSHIVFSRILVAMDSSGHSEAALEAATLLAKATRASMHGLFVYDEKWLRISRLPSMAEVNELTGEIEPQVIHRLEQQIRILEERIQRKFEQVSQKNRITHTWKAVEGYVEKKLLEASKEADLITIGTKGKSYSGRNRIGSTARAIIKKSEKPVLILQQGIRFGYSIIAVYDGSEASLKGMDLAFYLAEKNDSDLLIIKSKAR